MTPSLRKADLADVPSAAQIMKAAFSMWESIGFPLSTLTTESVGTFFAKDGYVFEDAQGKMLGVVCVNFSQPRLEGLDMHVKRAHRDDKTTLLSRAVVDKVQKTRCSYFYSLAVAPAHSRAGLGRVCVESVEDLAREQDCGALILETAERSGWLVEWYARLGFQPIGRFNRGGEAFVTMMKDLS